MIAKCYKMVRLILFSYWPEKGGDRHSTCQLQCVSDVLYIVDLEIEIPVSHLTSFSLLSLHSLPDMDKKFWALFDDAIPVELVC